MYQRVNLYARWGLESHWLLNGFSIIFPKFQSVGFLGVSGSLTYHMTMASAKVAAGFRPVKEYAFNAVRAEAYKRSGA